MPTLRSETFFFQYVLILYSLRAFTLCLPILRPNVIAAEISRAVGSPAAQSEVVNGKAAAADDDTATAMLMRRQRSLQKQRRLSGTDFRIPVALTRAALAVRSVF